jgi:hypothetical protein
MSIENIKLFFYNFLTLNAYLYVSPTSSWPVNETKINIHTIRIITHVNYIPFILLCLCDGFALILTWISPLAVNTYYTKHLKWMSPYFNLDITISHF